MNPAFRTSSPQPSTYESHHDPDSALAKEFNGRLSIQSEEGKVGRSPTRAPASHSPQAHVDYDDVPTVPHDPYPMDGMTQFCRLGPPSDRSSIPSPTRPDSRNMSMSEYSNPNSFTSYEPSSGHPSPTKGLDGSEISSNGDDRQIQKKKSGFFQNHSPFRRRSKHERDQSVSTPNTPSTRNTWAPPSARAGASASPTRPTGRESRNVGFGNGEPERTPDPEPVDPRASFQLNIGNNVFDVASPDKRTRTSPQKPVDENDPIAQALAELKGVTKQTSVRQSADRYHGLATPAPGTPGVGETTPRNNVPRPFAGADVRAGRGGTPPPSYDQPMSRLGAPQPAFTSKQMQQTTASYVNQKRDMFNSPARQHGQEPRSQSAMGTRSNARDGRPSDIPRATSPAPMRSTSPRPYASGDPRAAQMMPRATSPNPYGRGPSGGPGGRPHSQMSSPVRMQNGPHGSMQHGGSPNNMPRTASPQPGYNGRGGSRPPSSRGSDHGAMALQLAPGSDPGYGSGPPARSGYNGAPRPTSQIYGSDGPFAAAGQMGGRRGSQSNGVGGPQRQVSRDGRPIMHFGK